MDKGNAGYWDNQAFEVTKPVGWRIVHDFRGINSKLRIPAAPVPREEDIYDAMAGGYYFSAMDLLCFFSSAASTETHTVYCFLDT
ncbi:hypothetical protein PHMEG_00028577 [Phytophthora megakarya]|uniref:Reverse transcriptase n=1 Tax=Phytophthora megakarya TaxID=4795 RepID=A0A225V461_9STRA|nr:hypothetical protein PHMEG_00028577 [Phytophthora megakarya]